MLYQKCIRLMMLSFICISASLYNVKAQTTYALIVGISDYENAALSKLEFAHKDAQLFTDLLKSNSGGAVPDSNITMLLNNEASYGAIYDALNRLIEKCQKEDRVYIYFSGHGDMEQNTIYKRGFLLAYNTPNGNYINNAVRIEDINDVANTLSVSKKAKVVIITDACHSGNLNDTRLKHTALIGEQLRSAASNEVRMASCLPDQLSAEDSTWGGGHGVFTYYLVNGLKGQAETNHDGEIKLHELQQYLDTAFSKDQTLLSRNHQQNATLSGKSDTKLAISDTQFVRLQTIGQNNPNPVLSPIAQSEFSFFFNRLQTLPIEDLSELAIYNDDAVSTLPENVLRWAFKKNVFANDSSKLSRLQLKLAVNPSLRNRFNNKLAVLISDKGQELINQYLNVNPNELNNRSYFTKKYPIYASYANLFVMAQKLCEQQDYLNRILQIKAFYFRGLSFRLQQIATSDTTLLDSALEQLKHAVQLEPNAAYIYNELGNILYYKKDFNGAEKNFIKATQINTAWAIPWTNLLVLYNDQKQKEKALSAKENAEQFQGNNLHTLLNSGKYYMLNKNYLSAKECFAACIRINPRHYLPYLQLAQIYLAENNYPTADSFFHLSNFFHPKNFNTLTSSAVSRIVINPIKLPTSQNDVVMSIGPLKSPVKDTTIELCEVIKPLYESEQLFSTDYNHSVRLLKPLLKENKEIAVAAYFALFEHALKTNNYTDALYYLDYANTYTSKQQRYEAWIDSVAEICEFINSNDKKMLAANYFDKNNIAELRTNILRRQFRFESDEVNLKTKILNNHATWADHQSLAELYYEKHDYKLAIETLTKSQEKFGKDAITALAYMLEKILKEENDDISILTASAEFYQDLAFNNFSTRPYRLAHGIQTLQEIEAQQNQLKIIPELSVYQRLLLPHTSAIEFWTRITNTTNNQNLEYKAYCAMHQLYARCGFYDSAIVFGKKALAVYANNSTLRDSMIVYAYLVDQYNVALEQLKYFWEKQLLPFNKLSELSQLLISSNNLQEAEKLQNYWSDVLIEQENTEWQKQQAQLLTAQEQYAKAIQMMQTKQANTNNAYTYQLARLHQLNGNEKMALAELKKSIEQGFNFAYVVLNDKTWDNIQNKAAWDGYLQKMKKKNYTAPTQF